MYYCVKNLFSAYQSSDIKKYDNASQFYCTVKKRKKKEKLSKLKKFKETSFRRFLSFLNLF